jgi:hypothetical protein
MVQNKVRNKPTNTLERVYLHNLEGAFCRITQALDNTVDLELDFEVSYLLEDLQGSIQKLIEATNL